MFQYPLLRAYADRHAGLLQIRPRRPVQDYDSLLQQDVRKRTGVSGAVAPALKDERAVKDVARKLSHHNLPRADGARRKGLRPRAVR